VWANPPRCLIILGLAPHPPFPASGEKELSSVPLAPRSGERVAEGRVKGPPLQPQFPQMIHGTISTMKWPAAPVQLIEPSGLNWLT
jgi:hypothetical protein